MNRPSQFVSAREIQQKFTISTASLRRWDKDGRVETIRTPGGFRLYKLSDVSRLFSSRSVSTSSQGDGNESNEQEETTTPRITICYARVSSDQQKDDLGRQVETLQAKYPEADELIKDVGSGLNYKRKGFQRLLDKVYAGLVKQVVVTHKDRLCRYGTELVEHLFSKTDTKLVVLGQSVEEQDSNQELAEDLLAVCNFFVARRNGLRSAQNRRERSKRRRIEQREQKEDEEDQTSSGEGEES